MRAHFLQHVVFEDLAAIEPWLLQRGYSLTGTRFFSSTLLPDPSDIDFLIVMGGPMSVNDERRFPWLVDEKRFIGKVIEVGKPVLGICLGAQLIASALGAEVYPNDVKEIGWFPVEGVSSDGDSIFKFPASFDVFHWHGETFDLPAGAVRLAKSAGCRNQAFQLGMRVIGLQFHLEVTVASTANITVNCRDELVPSTFIQSEDEILAATHDKYRIVNGVMAEILSFLTT